MLQYQQRLNILLILLIEERKFVQVCIAMELTVFCMLNEKKYINSKQKIQNQIHAHFVTVDKMKKQD